MLPRRKAAAAPRAAKHWQLDESRQVLPAVVPSPPPVVLAAPGEVRAPSRSRSSSRSRSLSRSRSRSRSRSFAAAEAPSRPTSGIQSALSQLEADARRLELESGSCEGSSAGRATLHSVELAEVAATDVALSIDALAADASDEVGREEAASLRQRLRGVATSLARSRRNCLDVF